MSTTTTTTTTTTTDAEQVETLAQAALDEQAKSYERAADRVAKKYTRGKITAEEKLLETCRLISEAFGTDPRTGDRYYEPVDVLAWFARVVELEAESDLPVDVPVVGGRNIRHLFTRDLIPNAVLRERFENLREAGQMSASRLALRIGSTKTQDGQTVGDASAVERMLGVIPSSPETASDGRQYRSLRLFVTYDQAVLLADALGLYFHEVGV